MRHAEDSLKRLDKVHVFLYHSELAIATLYIQALRDSGIKIDIEIEADVTNLKSRLATLYA